MICSSSCDNATSGETVAGVAVSFSTFFGLAGEVAVGVFFETAFAAAGKDGRAGRALGAGLEFAFLATFLTGVFEIVFFAISLPSPHASEFLAGFRLADRLSRGAPQPKAEGAKPHWPNFTWQTRCSDI